MAGVYIVMGVSGCGKTTIGKLLAEKLAIPFYDADDFHPQVNIDTMASGVPLQDQDRWPWLDTLAQEIQKWERGEGAVLACSALREVYRERLFSKSDAFAKAKNNFIYLYAGFDLIKERLSQRKAHFFDPKLLQSQFETLEEPEYGVRVDVRLDREAILEKILRRYA